MENKKALITGITGQDGSYLADFLIHKGYEVHGIVRKASNFNTQRIDHLFKDFNKPDKLFLHYGDMLDATTLIDIINKVKPDEIYHLAAQSHVRTSFDIPEYTANTDAVGTLRLLEAIRLLGLEKKVKFYQASTSELYGKVTQIPQHEETPFKPRSPYAIAKLYAYWMTRNYREAYGLFASNGILFNHESPRRGESFITRKITVGIAKIKAGLASKIYLGNIDAKRDWGFAPEYVETMWRILQQDQPDDFVVATGQTHSVQEFLEHAFKYAGLGDWQQYVVIDRQYFRPTEVDVLLGDSTKAKNTFGWEPKITFEELVKIMVDADLRGVGLTPVGEGDAILARKFPEKWWNDGEQMPAVLGVNGAKEKILVTGAGGFIGHHLVRFLKKKGYWVRGVDIKYPEYSPQNEADEFLILDLRDFTNCQKAVAGIDRVYNLAADMGGIGFITAVKADLVRNNILINTNMAEAARVGGVKRLFFSSSACIYPKYKQEDPNVVALKESDAYPADPEDGYGWEKLISERMYKNFSDDHGLEVRIARFHNIFGPEGTFDGGREKAPAALCRKIAKANNGDFVEIWGDGKQTRSFCYVDDCVEAIWRLMESNHSEPLNVGSDHLVSIDTLFDMITAISGKSVQKKHLLDKPQGVRGRNSDNTLCKQVLGWESDISLEEGLRRTYEWVKTKV